MKEESEDGEGDGGDPKPVGPPPAITTAVGHRQVFFSFIGES